VTTRKVDRADSKAQLLFSPGEIYDFEFTPSGAGDLSLQFGAPHFRREFSCCREFRPFLRAPSFPCAFGEDEGMVVAAGLLHFGP
jgi:hypothetical protein